jgi:hypothetical protein
MFIENENISIRVRVHGMSADLAAALWAGLLLLGASHDHGHLVTHGKRDGGSWAEAQLGFKDFAARAKPGAQVEVPTLATVDGEMVTMCGAGVDIFRVRHGKITDHWDASPPAAVSVKAHPPGTAERVMRGAGPPSGPPASPPPN